MKETGKRRFVRRRYRFSGRVQGVGFRYRACCLAQQFRLTGWVRNLPDGDVEAEIEGETAAVDELVLRLGDSRWIAIDSIQAAEIPVRDEEHGFRIIH